MADILMLVVGVIIGLVPPIILYKWVLKKGKDGEVKEIYKKAFKYGIIVALPITLASGALSIIGNLTGLKEANPLLYQFYYTVIVLAFAEELLKFLVFKRVLKKNDYPYSWYDLTILMMLVGLGFQCIETATYAFDSGIMQMVLRGVSLGHAGYGIIMGWFYGKMQKTGKKIYGVLSLLIPLILHGLYDFGLSEELIKVNDNWKFLSLVLEAVCIVFVVLIIRFVRKRSESEVYTEPLKKHD